MQQRSSQSRRGGRQPGEAKGRTRTVRRGEALAVERREERGEAQGVLLDVARVGAVLGLEALLEGAVERGQVPPERGAGAAGAPDLRGDVGEEALHEAGRVEAAEGLLGPAEGEEAQDLLEEAGARGGEDLVGVAADRLERVGVDREAEARGEADGAEHADGVLAEADVRVADAAQDPLAQVAQAADVVDHAVLERVVEERVHREVAAEGVLLGRAEGVVAHLVERAGRLRVAAAGRGGAGGVVRLRVAAEGRGLDLLLAEADQREAEAAPDDEGVAEEPLDLARAGVGRHVEVLGRAAEEDVADAAADEIRDEAGVVEAVQDGERVGVDVARGDLRGGTEPVEKGHQRYFRSMAKKRSVSRTGWILLRSSP